MKTPLWMTVIIIIFLLPVFAFPILLANLPAGDEAVRLFVWIYPFYMVLSAWLAWKRLSAQVIYQLDFADTDGAVDGGGVDSRTPSDGYCHLNQTL